jgi:hypothetical protein
VGPDRAVPAHNPAQLDITWIMGVRERIGLTTCEAWNKAPPSSVVRVHTTPLKG